MKKMLIVVVIVLLVVLGAGAAIGACSGKSERKSEKTQESSKRIEQKTTDEQIDPGDAEYENKETVISVSVVGNEYFCQNERILLDDFMKKIEDEEGEIIVEIKDDNASLKAYNDLISSLNDAKISYIEK